MVTKLAVTFHLDPKLTTIAFIPTAADVYYDRTFVDNDRSSLQALGYGIKEVDLKGHDAASLRVAFAGCQGILVAGGNTFYLLQEAKASGFDVVIRELVDQGVFYIGSSAGSVCIGSSIEPVRTLDDPNDAPELESFDGIGLIDVVPLPHAKNQKYATIYDQILKDYGEKYSIVELTDWQAMIVDGDHTSILDLE